MFLGINDMTACLIVSGSQPEVNESSSTQSRIGLSSGAIFCFKEFTLISFRKSVMTDLPE